jgi:hypothetical protein
MGTGHAIVNPRQNNRIDRRGRGKLGVAPHYRGGAPSKGGLRTVIRGGGGRGLSARA